MIKYCLKGIIIIVSFNTIECSDVSTSLKTHGITTLGQQNPVQVNSQVQCYNDLRKHLSPNEKSLNQKLSDQELSHVKHDEKNINFEKHRTDPKNQNSIKYSFFIVDSRSTHRMIQERKLTIGNSQNDKLNKLLENIADENANTYIQAQQPHHDKVSELVEQKDNHLRNLFLHQNYDAIKSYLSNK